MSKQEFLVRLRNALSRLPSVDIEERLTFYSEMIDDRMEEGYSEEEAVLATGKVDEIAAQAVADVPLAPISKEGSNSGRRRKAELIVLLVLGCPIWISLAGSVLGAILSIYISIWSVIISLWTVSISVAVCAVAGIAAGIVLAIGGNVVAGTAMLGAGILCAGLSIFLFCGCEGVSKGVLLLTKKATVWIKKRFMKKEGA